ncbi:MAG: PilZ domain-containing protein, partial [Treponema sp.]|nr:PilZ domain-containing protein [Treponema sp.]
SGAIGGGGAPRKFNAFTLYRISSEYGLDKDQSKLLENIFKNNAVTDPERVIKNSSLLDRQFKRTYKSIEKNSETEEDAQQHLVKLFSLRNVIEAGSDSNNPASTQLAENTPAILVSGNDNYPVRLYSSKGLNIVTEIPRNAVGTPVRMSKGANVTLSFFTKSSKGFALEGQVTGVVETSHGQGLQITHNGKMKPLVKRMYRRRQITIRCSFYHVFLEDSGMGRKKSQKLVVDNKRLTGHVLDVSIGGCSIKTTAPIQVGSRLKIAIDYDENYVINVLGQVIRTNRSGPAGAIIHIKFLKVPRRAFNSISALVFGYDED